MKQGAGARRPHVVVLGAGFGGLETVLALRRADVDVTLVDRRNFHLFQPLLYQVATGGLSPGDIASPIRWVLRKLKHVRVLLGEAAQIDVDRRCIELRDGGRLEYDALVVATGARNHYFGRDEWATHAPGLKTVEDALEMRSRIFYAFEAAERETDPEARRAWLTFVVVGAGPTGAELAGALGELANDTLPSDFRDVDPSEARILLAEAGERVLPGYPEALSRRAEQSLQSLGVETVLRTKVREIDEKGVLLESRGELRRIEARTVLWGAGVRASSLGSELAARAGVETDQGGRIPVEPDCSLPGHPEIFVVGDLARYEQDGEPLPGIAPVAMQQGRHVGRLLRDRARGRRERRFRYRHRGNLATLGRSRAVADFGTLRFSAFPAWLLWLVVHVAFLVSFENRVLVLVQWAWNYFTRNRGTRIITAGADDVRGSDPLQSD